MRSNLHLDTLHHAYLFVGERNIVKGELLAFFKENDIAVSANPDFWFQEFHSFAVDDARALAVMQNRKSFESTESKKFFMIALHSATDEAQNALLKIFEEPTAGTHFFIIAPHANFLPTFLSRVQVIKHPLEGAHQGDEKRVVIMSLPERLAYVASLAEEIADEKQSKQDAIDLVNAIERELSTDVIRNAEKLWACEEARKALFSRGAMIKMILENLMLWV